MDGGCYICYGALSPILSSVLFTYWPTQVYHQTTFIITRGIQESRDWLTDKVSNGPSDDWVNNALTNYLLKVDGIDLTTVCDAGEPG